MVFALPRSEKPGLESMPNPKLAGEGDRLFAESVQPAPAYIELE
jgi:hypothetical protein